MMDIPTKQIEEYVSESRSKNLECEIVMNKYMTSKDGFNRMLKYVNTNYSIIETIHRESLDIRFYDKSDMRLTITGKDSILEYCKNNTVPLSDVLLIMKKRVEELPSIQMPDYDIRMNVNHELIPNDDDATEFMKTIRGKEKMFRYKKRYSFVDNDKALRVDMTIVKSSFYKKAKTLNKSKTLSNIEEFEVEVEILNDSQLTANLIVGKLSALLEVLLKLNHNVQKLLPKGKKEALLSEYVNLVDPELDLELFKNSKSRYFLRYQPITLMKRNLLEDDVDVVSIQNDYSCTEKADGERYLMYICNIGEVYFINSRMLLFPTNLKHPTMRKTIVDGEYITKGKLNTKLNMYMGFDCYYVNGKDIRNLGLVDRLQIIKDMVQDWKPTEMTIDVKKFYYGSKNIMVDTKQCLQKSTLLPYHTDGLIFTPLNLSPGALYLNDTTMNPFGGTWNKVFKWKPPEENTIDVLVKFGDECIVENEKGVKQKCVYADLYVAYKGSLESTLNVIDMYNNIDKNAKQSVTNNKIIKRLYDFTYLPLDNNNKYPTTNDTNEPIMNEVIVEMAYVPNSPYMKWTPLRLRNDKTAIMKQTNSIENAANNYNTVMNVWMSISDPVTSKMLTGEEVLDKDQVKLDNQDLYYARETPRYRTLLRPLLDFHNFWVKKKTLFDLFHDKKYRLLEIGCGQAGDLPKWIDNKFSQIVGIDNNEDNLLNSNHGAYRRVLENISSVERRPKIDIRNQTFLFLLLDGGVKWTKNVVDTIESDEFSYLTRIAMGTIDKSKISNKLLQRSYNCLNDPFDVISCQFAVHYFFKNMESIDNFCYNLNNNLKVNGYFIGCCLDGHLVHNAFVTKKKTLIRGELNKKIMWQIEKKYDTYELNSKGSENLGKQIDVYVETINKIIPEYLVDFELFKRKLAEYNIYLVDVDTEKDIKLKTSHSSGSLEILWNNMVQANKKGYKHWAVTNAIDNMTDDMKEYSFMNRWFIFKKK
jgi:hypothetical protein